MRIADDPETPWLKKRDNKKTAQNFVIRRILRPYYYNVTNLVKILFFFKVWNKG
jgi:hypothetical protein